MHCTFLNDAPAWCLECEGQLKEIEDQLENDPSLSEEERQSKIKSEKIKIALEKLKKANIQKLIVRVFTDDGSSKTVFLDETMSCRGVTSMMIEKNHLEYKPMLAILEQVPDLYMERIVEDHENLVNDVLLNWKRETTSRILFSERKEKYGIFKNPQNYLLSTSSSQAAQQFAEKSKEVLIKEFFSDTGSQIPEVDGVLWMKAEGKKSWKRFYFILRASGLYFSPKGKSKSSKDLVCLVGFEHNHVYHGVSWKKKYKAPTDHCFAIKHPQLQQKSKYIKYLCAEDYRSCQRWIAGIRLAKYGRQLLLNYNQTQQELREYKVRHISETSSITNGMPDTVSLSSMHSTVSSHSSSSGSYTTADPVVVHHYRSISPLKSYRYRRTHRSGEARSEICLPTPGRKVWKLTVKVPMRSLYFITVGQVAGCFC
ncbi:putative ras-associated and pleckstrin-likey domains-containing protein 1 isoform X6 [Apostichopus japonicus]|uniref:Putative ras-associated and pleckstrin-likey domains-containing protein 1 isoform X6 n=1 Tax=Stichopus japonicus TaxID=307972 RepID=A0A2G8LMD9_STIJA|nr:putative ras-associated and pleckstrin-likey domains-containing protein 1 isoform X6 [Apostichopus japonicus]